VLANLRDQAEVGGNSPGKHVLIELLHSGKQSGREKDEKILLSNLTYIS